MKILGIEEDAISKNDLVIFLYAVGLVSNERRGVNHSLSDSPLITHIEPH